ncbi:MAG: hypothetical protein JWM55_713 [Acidimicrobiaceae bacterium]|nr:hypothetical protein [Acidimicrobiaceae bacterium]
MRITIVGAGRAGTSLYDALSAVGHDVRLRHHDELRDVDSELVLLCVPDDAIETVSSELSVDEGTVVAHVAGSRGLTELSRHARRASMHPLAVLPNRSVGAARLRGALYSVGGDRVVDEVVASLGGRALRLSDEQRVLYHATASVTANHLVALLGHARSLAEAAGLSLEDFLPLAQQALDDVKAMGVDAALTGPASRADMVTIDAHLEALPPTERSTYVALANAAFELAEKRRATSGV